MKLNKLVSAAVVAGALTFAGAASAGVITLSPTNTNPGCTNLTAGACGAVGTAANFDTDNAITRYVGVIDIAAAAGATTYAESGSLRVESFSLNGNQINGSGVNKGGTGNYDIYAVYSITGGGVWFNPALFLATSFTTFSVSLYAAPSSGGAPTIATPTSGFDPTGGITHGAGAFLLGTSSIITQLSNNASVSINSPGSATGGTASSTLSVLVDFTPAAGTAGPTGFFFAPDPFIITIGAAAGGQSNNTRWDPNAGGVRVTTSASNPGGGSLAFGVPEPGMLTLLGVSLVGLAAVGRRRMKVQR